MPLRPLRIPGTATAREAKEIRHIDRSDFEQALQDPALAPTIEAALRVRGLSPETLFPAGARLAIWSKTYTESSRASISNEETGDQLAVFGREPSVAELTVLADITQPKQ